MDMFHTKGAALLVEAILSLKNEEECPGPFWKM